MQGTIYRRIRALSLIGWVLVASACDNDDSNQDLETTTSTTTTTDPTTPHSDTEEDPINCGEIQCSPGSLTECGEGRKCTPYRCNPSACCTDTARCTEVTGIKTANEACVRDAVLGIDDCAPGHFCMPDTHLSSGEGPGRCGRLCDANNKDPAQCPGFGVPNGHCFAFNGGSTPACVPPCDPLDPNACPEGEGCYFAIDDYFCSGSSEPVEGEGIQGNGCNTEQGCAPGFACVPAETQKDCTFACDATAVCGCCSRYCDTTLGDEQCEAGMKCIDLPGDRPGVEHAGFCGLPQ